MRSLLSRVWPDPRIRDALFAGVLFTISSEIGALVAFADAPFVTFWPGNGVIVALLLARPAGRWDGIGIGTVIANILWNISLGTMSWRLSAAYSFCNLFEIFAAAGLVRHFLGADFDFRKIGKTVGFAGIAVLLVPAISGLLSALVASSPENEVEVTKLWRLWSVSDGIGMMLFAPFSYMLISMKPENLPRNMAPTRIVELAVAVVTTIVLAASVFLVPPSSTFFPFQVPYIALPPMVWASIRGGPFVAATTSLVVGMIAAYGTAHDLGPYTPAIEGSILNSISRLQVLMTSISLIALITSLLVEEIKTIQRQERRNAEVLRKFFASVRDPAFMKDTSGRYLLVNQAAASLIGRTVDEVVGRSDSELLPKDLLATVQREDQHLMLHGGSIESVREIGPKDGPMRYLISKKTVALDDSGKPIGILGVDTDVTSLKEIEKEMRRAKELAIAASQAKSSFVANMSHEIRTPLNAIIGMTDVLSKTSLDARQMEVVRILRSASTSLLGIVNDVLDVAKIESGRYSLNESPIDLREILDGAVKTLTNQARDKGLTLDLIVDASTPNELIGDETKIRQILVNLVGNAIKFTRQGGVLVRVTSNVRSNDAVVIELAVSDTGIGISSDRIEKIFAPFEQADSSIAQSFGGTGLGLPIAQELARLMQGGIRVDSRPGSGSTFTATILLKKDPAAKVSPPLMRRRSALIVGFEGIEQESLLEMMKYFRMQATAVKGLANLSDQALNGTTLGIFNTRTPSELTETLQWLSRTNAAEFTKWRNVAKVVVRVNTTSAKISDDQLIKLPNVEYATSALNHSDLRHLIELPKNEIESSRPTALSRTGTKPMRVLLVEDNAFNQRVVRELLSDHQVNISIAENGKQALALWATNSYDLILMDVQMPGMDGLETTRQIRDLERRTAAHTPIIGLTARVLPSDIQECRDAGMDGHVSKPFTEADLVRAMHRALSSPLEPHAVKVAEEDLAKIVVPSLSTLWPTQRENFVVQLQELQWEPMQRIAHELSGLSGYLGDDRVLRLARYLDRACRERNPDIVGQAFRTFSESYEDVLARLSPQGKAH